MSDMSAWSILQSAMQDEGTRRPVARATLRRVAAFAGPHRRALLAFVLLSTAGAVLGVATPVLAGQAVDAIVEGGRLDTVVVLASVIAGLAVVGAGMGLLERVQSARIGEGLILDLRRAVFDHVQAMPVAFFTRTRTGALVSRGSGPAGRRSPSRRRCTYLAARENARAPAMAPTLVHTSPTIAASFRVDKRRAPTR